MVSSQQGVSRPYFTTRDAQGQEHLREPRLDQVLLYEGVHDDYRYGEVCDLDLSGLAGSTLKVLDARQQPLRAVDLTPLSTVKGLQEVSFHDCDLQTLDLEPLRTCIALEQVYLSSNEIATLDLTVFEGMKHLKTLAISGNRLTEVDLEPLRTCPNLEYLAFAGNPLREIDLSPLSDCAKLRSLHIGGAYISTLNLTPLSQLRSLHTLEIIGTQIQEIDIAPLSRCTGIVELTISHNLLEEIDLTPLNALHQLESLSLSHNPLSSLDLSPLSMNANLYCIHLIGCELNDLDVTPVALLPNLSSIRGLDELQATLSFLPEHTNPAIEKVTQEIDGQSIQDIIHEGNWCSFRNEFISLLDRLTPASRLLFQGELLKQIGLHQYRALDYGLIPVLESLDIILSSEELSNSLVSYLIAKLIIQVEGHGATHFLNVDDLWPETVHHNLIEPLLQTRQTEMAKSVVYLYNGIVDLRPLWLTSYGFRILSSILDNQYINFSDHDAEKTAQIDIPFPLSFPDTYMSLIRTTLDNLGISLLVKQMPLADISSVCSFSESLIEYILWCARFDRPRTDEHK